MQLINTNPTKYLAASNHNSAGQLTNEVLSIETVSSDRFEQWLSELSPPEAQWVSSHEFSAETNQVVKLADDSGKISRIILGTGSLDDTCDLSSFAKLAKSLNAGNYQINSQQIRDQSQSDISLIGWAISQYEFDRYKAKKNTHAAVLMVKDQAQIEKLSPIINGICLVRDLVNTPACDMGPTHLSAVMAELASAYNAEFSECVGDELLARNFNTIHAVGRAAKDQPRLLELTWGKADACGSAPTIPANSRKGASLSQSPETRRQDPEMARTLLDKPVQKHHQSCRLADDCEQQIQVAEKEALRFPKRTTHRTASCTHFRT